MMLFYLFKVYFIKLPVAQNIHQVPPPPDNISGSSLTQDEVMINFLS